MRADRLLSILLILQVHGRMTGRQLAKRLEVSERTIHRDMEALGAAGVPVVAERGVGGGWELLDGFRTSLTALTTSEVNALFLTKPSQLLEDLRLDKASDAALVKLLSLMPSVHRRNAQLSSERIHIDVSGWHRSPDNVAFLPIARDAVFHERKLKIMYDRGECATERVINPLGLVAKGAVWYLVAAVGDDIRTYRVSRIRSADMLDETFARPQDFDLSTFWENAAATFREKLPRYEVVARVAASSVVWLQAFIRFGGIDAIENADDSGWSRVAMHFDAEEAALHTLLGLGTTVDVVEPRALRDRIAEAAARVAERNQ